MRYKLFRILLGLTLILISNGCQINNGEFFQIFTVNEEIPTGTIIGPVEFDDVQSISTLDVLESNQYFELIQRGRTYDIKVKKTIDIDNGVSRVQTMLLVCTTIQRLKLEVELEFEIKDVNDFSPEFKPSDIYQFTVPESSQTGIQVGVILAEDSDIQNLYVQYELRGGEGVFTLNALQSGGSGLMLQQRLDYEVKTQYSLQVIAKDCQTGGNCQEGQRSSTATILVKITDSDDLNPRFEQTAYVLNLPDNTQQNTAVLTVHAQDQDALNHTIEYSLSGKGSEYFTITQRTGEIRLSNIRGLQTGDNYLLQIEAAQSNNANRKDVASLLISIVPFKAEGLIFSERRIKLQLPETTLLNTTVCTVNLQREDEIGMRIATSFNPSKLSNNEKTTLTLIGDTGITKLFNISQVNNSVKIILVKKLDYEARKLLQFNLRAQNDQVIDEIPVEISVIDENDNEPVFLQNSYKFSLNLSEEALIVGQVHAQDEDTVNNQITYSIIDPTNSNGKLFTIDMNGVIYKTQTDPTLYTQSSYTILVQAADGGTTPRKTSTFVLINCTPENNDPILIQQHAEDSSSPNLTMFIIAGLCAGLLVVILILVVCVLKRRRKNNNRAPSSPTEGEPMPHDTLLKSPSTLFNGSYRDMSDLKHDVEYNTMWQGNTTLPLKCTYPSEKPGEEKLNNAPSRADSDSGRSSCYSRQYSPTMSRQRAEDPNHLSQPKRGLISTYLASMQNPDRKAENGNLVEAPEGFRSHIGSRTSMNSQLTVSYSTSYETQIPNIGRTSPTTSINDKSAENSPTKTHPQTVIQIYSRNVKSPEPGAVDSKLPLQSFTTFHADSQV